LGTNIHAGEEVRNAQSQEKKDFIWEADGFASVLPSDKREIVLILKEYFGVVTGMTGDGVNDAAALSAAQVGIAVEGATDAAKNAADLILTLSGLSPIYGAILESRRIFARIKVSMMEEYDASHCSWQSSACLPIHNSHLWPLIILFDAGLRRLSRCCLNYSCIDTLCHYICFRMCCGFTLGDHFGIAK
jgi:H+-transporting ATPase